MSSEAYVIIKQNEYMRKFRGAGALDPKTARPLAELGVRPTTGNLRKMADKDVFQAGPAPDSFYMDAGAAEGVR